jgi:hypothetical protein
MNQQEYYDSSLKYFNNELEREAKVITSLKKFYNRAKKEGWEPLDFMEEIIAEWETKRDYLISATRVVEAAEKG